MEYMYVCPKCKSIFKTTSDKPVFCLDCHLETVFTGYDSVTWYSFSLDVRREKILNITEEVLKQRKLEKQQEIEREKELNLANVCQADF